MRTIVLDTVKRAICATAIGALLFGSIATPALADWRSDWAAFAAKTGEPGHKAWAQLIADPKAKALDASWRSYRGYDASTLIAAGNIPAELKPGLEITAQNIGSMPYLNKYLPGFWRGRLGDKWLGLKKIRIVPTSHYYMSAPTLDATKKIDRSKLKINANGELLNSDGSFFMGSTGGIPYTEPKTGLELNYAQLGHGVGTDDLHFDPVTLTACNSQNVPERTYVGDIWWRKLAGRTEMAPLGVNKKFNGAQEAGALFFRSPRDVRGLAGVRIRYPSVDKQDDFKVFIPTLRRTRTLTGTNGQDPLAAGLEFAWDEWRSHWGKTDARKFDYKLAGETFILTMPEVGRGYDPIKMDASGCNAASVDLELRPVWILDITDKTGTYQYSKQRIFIDKELYYTQFKEMYDRSGKLVRVWDDSRDFDPTTGQSQWRNALIANVNAKRITYLSMKSDWAGRQTMNDSLFDIDQLRNR